PTILDDVGLDGQRMAYKILIPYLEPDLAPDLEWQLRRLLDGRYGPPISAELAERIGALLDHDYNPKINPSLPAQLQALIEGYGADLSRDVRQHLWALLSGKYGQRLHCITVRPVLLRTYPNGSLAGHVLGLVLYNQTGYYGVEGYYDDILGGDTVRTFKSIIPLDVGTELQTETNADVYLTIDREVQFLAEQVLSDSIVEFEAGSGMLLVADPGSGEILAIAASPGFDPNDITAVISDTENVGRNPAVSEQFEPGSVFKVLTMAAALESDVFSRYSTYYDTGKLEYGGIVIQNWDYKAHELQDMTGLLARSLNVGAATLSTTLGPKRYYDLLTAFGIGRLTHVDIAGEETGHLKRPGDPDWHDADLATNAFGQGVAVTGLQLVTAVSAVANGGVIMQPHLLREIRDGDMVYTVQPQVLGRPISAEVARTLTEMLATSLESESSLALVEGYRLAGKTGTAQIPMPYGYDPDRTMASFIGWGPLEDPQFIVYVKLDAPMLS
ncbi:MAG TPA: penicillin-binding protein 2, partial [Anaerolineales bacterium]|nr:penicillin-binding protein 2 [Anaerolineales bacterium]